MSRKIEQYAAVENLALEVCARHGVGLYDLEVKPTQKGQVVVLYLSKVGGVGHGRLRRREPGLQPRARRARSLRERLLPRGVLSAGIERKLRYKKHYTGAIGEQVKLTYHEEGKNRTLTGELLEVRPEHVLMRVDDQELLIAFTDIKKARTVFDMNAFAKVAKESDTCPET
jgi:ribosome maturation factor RimP